MIDIKPDISELLLEIKQESIIKIRRQLKKKLKQLRKDRNWRKYYEDDD